MKRLFLYCVLIRVGNQLIVKFGQTLQNSQEDAIQYAINETAGKLRAVISSSNIIFCNDVTDRALSDGFSFDNDFAKYDDFVRKFINQNNLNTGFHTYNRRNDVGGGSREIHTYYVDSVSEQEIKDNWVLSINEFITGVRKKGSYAPRVRQQEAIDKMINSYKQGLDEFLLGAIMRFGKNFTFLTFTKQIAQPGSSILVLTNKPGVFSSLEKDVNNHVYFDDYNYILVRDVKDLKNLKIDPTKINVFAVSKQLTDNRLRRRQVRKFLSNINFIAAMFDECHSGMDTEMFIDLRKQLNIKFTVWTSGTPYKTVATKGFKKENSYFYDYIDQQRDKKEGLITDAVTLETRIIDVDSIITSNPNFTNEEGFTLTKLFAVDDNGDFIFGGEVREFLKDVLGLSDKKSKYSPYRICQGALDHTVWLMPSNVKMIEATGKMLQNMLGDDFKIIMATGNNSKNIQDVHDAIKEYPKTITLTNMRFIEGTTVPEWSGALNMSDTDSVEKYFQFIFRVTTPDQNKDKAYVFDFNPSLAFKMIFELAHARATTHENNDIQEVIREWLDNNNVYRAGEGPAFKQVNVEDILSEIQKGDYQPVTLIKASNQYLMGDLTSVAEDWVNAGTKKKVKITTQVGNEKTGKNYTQQGGKEKSKRELDMLFEIQANIAGVVASFPAIKYMEELNTVEEIILNLDSNLFKEYTGIDKSIFSKLIDYKLIDTRFINLYL